MTAPGSFFHAPRLRWIAFAVVGAAFVSGRMWREQTRRPVVLPGARVAQTGRVTTPQTAFVSPGKAGGAKMSKPRFAVAATFAQVQDLVESEYVDPLPSDATLAHGATQAMLATLEDEQSRFLLPGERATLEREKAGNFVGIGAATAIRGERIAAGYTELHLLVVAPLPGSPAQKAGLRTGDRVTHLDGHYILSGNPYLTPSKMPTAKPTEDDDPQKNGVGLLVAQRALRQGTTGTHILTVSRPGTKQPIRLTVGTGAVAVPPVKLSRLGAATVVQVGAFTKSAETTITDALRGVPPGASVVLDLRQNPGVGSFESARNIAGRLAGGKVFAVEVGVGGKRSFLPMPGGATVPRRKIAVLTDGGTAGLSEAVANYLVGNGASLVGTGRTWGDGRSSTLYPLADGSGYTLTTGRLIGAAGIGWDNVGLAPRLLLPKGLSEGETLARAARAATAGAAVVAKGAGTK